MQAVYDQIQKPKTDREAVLKKILEAHYDGALGYFIGTGFSMALTNNNAWSWGKLIQECCGRLKVTITNDEMIGKSYPEIATELCKKYSLFNKCEMTESYRKLKDIISKLVTWYPESAQKQTFNKLISETKPSWIITTNYDMIIESVLIGDYLNLDSTELFERKGALIPVWHIHGHRYEPDNIVITQEDYVRLFRPDQYRQLRLAFLFKESTTVFIGYSIGDFNVQSAIDRSRCSYNRPEDSEHIDVISIQTALKQKGVVIQVLRTNKDYKAEPYFNESGVIIIEIDEICNFFSELNTLKTSFDLQMDKLLGLIDKIKNQLNKASQTIMNQIKCNNKSLIKLLEKSFQYRHFLMPALEDFIEKTIDDSLKQSQKINNFKEYNTCLILILDLLENIENDKYKARLMYILAVKLDKLAPKLGANHGQAWKAYETLCTRIKKLKCNTINELRSISEQNNFERLKNLLLDNACTTED